MAVGSSMLATMLTEPPQWPLLAPVDASSVGGRLPRPDGVSCARHVAFGAKTPLKRVRWARGGGTSAAGLASGGKRSRRVERIYPKFTKIGPSAVSAIAKCSPRGKASTSADSQRTNQRSTPSRRRTRRVVDQVVKSIACGGAGNSQEARQQGDGAHVALTPSFTSRPRTRASSRSARSRMRSISSRKSSSSGRATRSRLSSRR